MKQYKRSFLSMLILLALTFGTLGLFSTVNAGPARVSQMGRPEVGSNRLLLLDHDLDWTTFLGNDNPQTGPTIAVDAAGNVFVIGITDPGNDAYIAKLNPSTGSVVWNVVLTGSKGASIAVDGSGNIFVTGWSNATWGSPVQAFLSGGANAFVAKMNASTGDLVWNTFLNTFEVAPEASDQSLSIVVDEIGNVFVLGTSSATWGDSPVWAYDAGLDSFVAKLNALTGSLTWNTFLGGSGHDNGLSIAADAGGNIFVTGRSNATWGDSPVMAYDAGFDVFVAKLDASDGSLIWNTFLGYGDFDYGFSIAVDGSGNVFVTGYGGRTFVAKFNPSTGGLIWNTLLGATGIDTGYGIAVDSSTGNIVIVGQSGATWGSPVRSYTPSSVPTSDSFAAGLDSGTGSLIWNTFLGGDGNDDAYSLAVDGLGNIFVLGGSDATWSSPVLPFTGYPSGDGFIAKLSNDTAIETATATATATDIATSTPTVTPMLTNTVTATITPTNTATATPTATETFTPTETVTITPTVTPTFTPTVTPTKTPVTIVIPSSGICDGWVLKSSVSSPVGVLNSATTTLRLGDDMFHRQYRSVLCFKTSVLPDTATITHVILRVKKQGILGGGNPVSMFNGFRADIKTGFFGLSSALELVDFGAPSSGSFGPFIIGTSGGFYNIDLTAGAGLINKLSSGAGQTQIRLRFSIPSNMNSIANILSLFSGNALPADRPQLVITY